MEVRIEVPVFRHTAQLNEGAALRCLLLHVYKTLFRVAMGLGKEEDFNCELAKSLNGIGVNQEPVIGTVKANGIA
jgi:hypothetical protein